MTNGNNAEIKENTPDFEPETAQNGTQILLLSCQVESDSSEQNSKILTKPPRPGNKSLSIIRQFLNSYILCCTQPLQQDPEFKPPAFRTDIYDIFFSPNKLSTVHSLPAKERLGNKNRKAVLYMIAM